MDDWIFISLSTSRAPKNVQWFKDQKLFDWVFCQREKMFNYIVNNILKKT